MKIYNINDVPEFFERVLDCTGNVYFKDGEGAVHDLKQVARQYFVCRWPFQAVRMDVIDVIVEQPEDCRGIYRYAMEAR